MARNWPRLVLAVATASAVLATPVAMPDVARAAPKKKAAAKAEPDQDGGAQPAEGKRKQDPIEAQKTIEASLKLIEAGKSDTAVQSLSATIAAGNLPPGLMARALYYRGMGQRQLQKPAQAIADLTQALWIKGGLGESDRAQALKQRSGAYADAGLADQPLPVASAQPKASTSTASTSSGSGWNLFGGFGNGFTLFNSGGQGTPPASAPPPPVAVASAPPPPQPGAAPGSPSVSSWSSTTEVRATPAAMTAAAPTETASAAPAARAEGKFKVQVGLVRTDSEAQAIGARVRGDLSAVFEAREPIVDQTVVGNFGSMYRVRVGPYASAGAGQAVCTRLRGSGLDCLVVSQ
ncbi:MAG: SPOR domain-containing protein [Hyphomicrobiaceae bacterium]|nr:SPOR domain-containing protein [Hyphomicrobiaceae bacterium]